MSTENQHKFNVLPCSRCGQKFAGQGHLEFNDSGQATEIVCQQCWALSEDDYGLHACEKCGVQRPATNVREVYNNAGDMRGVICDQCDNAARDDQTHKRQRDRSDWHDAITLAALYGDTDTSFAMLQTLERRELEHLALRLAAIVHMRGTYMTDLTDNDAWLDALRDQINEWGLDR